MIVHNRQEAYDRLADRLTRLNRHSEIASLGGRPIGPQDPNRTYHEFIVGDLTYTVYSTGQMDLPPSPPIA